MNKVDTTGLWIYHTNAEKLAKGEGAEFWNLTISSPPPGPENWVPLCPMTQEIYIPEEVVNSARKVAVEAIDATIDELYSKIKVCEQTKQDLLCITYQGS